MAGLFQVLWGGRGGTFQKAAAVIGTDNQPLVIPSKSERDVVESICTRPTAVDWDGDGDLDLVVGTFAGSFYLFNGAGRGKFAPTPRRVETASGPLQLNGQHGDPFVIDWDGDGDLDLLSGSSNGGVQWAENSAGPKKPPVLKSFVSLVPANAGHFVECRPEEVTEPAASTRVWAGDVNGDGKLDLLVGDCITLLSPAKGVSESEYQRRHAEWTAAKAALAKEFEAPDLSEAKQQEMSKRYGELYRQREEFTNVDPTGFVWVYLRK